MNGADKIGILKSYSDQKSARLLAKAKELASNMAESAKAIEQAAAEGDLVRLTWLTRAFDPTLAAAIDNHYDTAHFIEGLAK